MRTVQNDEVDPTANVKVFVSEGFKSLSFSNWLQNEIMKRWAPPKAQWRVDIAEDASKASGDDVFDFLRAAESAEATSPKAESPATSPSQRKIKKIWLDRRYEGYLIAACLMNRVNSLNVKHRPYDQVTAC